MDPFASVPFRHHRSPHRERWADWHRAKTMGPVKKGPFSAYQGPNRRKCQITGGITKGMRERYLHEPVNSTTQDAEKGVLLVLLQYT